MTANKGRRHKNIAEHNYIRLATRFEDIESAVAQLNEDLEIVRALVRTTHDELKQGRRCRERTYNDLKVTA